MLRHKWLQCTESTKDYNRIRAEEKWNKTHLKPNADTIKEMFFGMKHVIEVDYNKIYEKWDVQGWMVSEAFKDGFYYPNRKLGDHAVVHLMRGDYSADEYIFTSNEFGGDAVFVGTNNDNDALLIALKYK